MSIERQDDHRTSRLSLWHFFLWIAVASLLSVRTTGAFSLALLVSNVINSAAVTAAIVVIFQATWYRRWLHTEPGYWFALVAVWVFVDQWAITPGLYNVAPRQAEYIYAIFFVGAALLFFVGMTLGDWGKLWKLAIGANGLVFALAAAWRIVQELGDWQDTASVIRVQVSPGIDLLAVALVLIAVPLDLWRGELRDWKHWAGLVWFAFHWVSIVQAYVVPYLFP